MEDLEVLQNRIRKDPEANYDSFLQKWNELLAAFEIAKLTPQIYNTTFMKLLNFVTHTLPFYNAATADVDEQYFGSIKGPGDEPPVPEDGNRGRRLCLMLVEFVKANKNAMDVKMRRLIIGSTFLLRSKKQIDLITILMHWLDLLDLNDKEQRKKLFNYIVKDLVLLNAKFKHSQVMKKLENVLFEKINKRNTDLNVRLLSCCIVVEMYRRRVWNDLYTLNQLCELCLTQNTKIALASVYFLLSSKNHYNLIFTIAEDKAQPEDPDEDGKGKRELKEGGGHIMDIYEPYKLVEGLLQRCYKNEFKYEQKLTVLKLVAIVINRHRLIVPNFYSYLSKYMHHKQQLVTRVLMAFIISVHAELSVELIEPVIEKIINDFVSYDRSDSVITIGINTIREVCNKLPAVLNEETLTYLVEFKNYRSKNVNVSVKSLINLYRKLNPKLLNKSVRGKESNMLLLKEKRLEKLKVMKDESEPAEPRDDQGSDGGESEVSSEDELSDELEEAELEVDEEDVDDKDEDEADSDELEDGEDDGPEAAEGPDPRTDSGSESDSSEESDERKLLFTTAKKMKSHDKRREMMLNKMDKRSKQKLAESKKGKKQSLTNRIKQRNKPLLMTLQSRRVRSKRNMSISEQMSRLKRHIKSLKKGNLKKKQRRHS